jgi:hypothetical protein
VLPRWSATILRLTESVRLKVVVPWNVFGLNTSEMTAGANEHGGRKTSKGLEVRVTSLSCQMYPQKSGCVLV